jgi:predicted SnoaL-like aldol condensation-catalyzing enzyme
MEFSRRKTAMTPAQREALKAILNYAESEESDHWHSNAVAEGMDPFIDYSPDYVNDHIYHAIRTVRAMLDA